MPSIVRISSFALASLVAVFIVLPSLQRAAAVGYIDAYLRMDASGSGNEHFGRVHLFVQDSIQLGFFLRGFMNLDPYPFAWTVYTELVPLGGPVHVWAPIEDRPDRLSAVLVATILGSLVVAGFARLVGLRVLQYADATLAWRHPPSEFPANGVRRRVERAGWLLFLFLSPLVAAGVWRATAGFHAAHVLDPSAIGPTWFQIADVLLALGLTGILLDTALAMALARRALSPDQRTTARACARCGYNIGPLPQCPECGCRPVSSFAAITRRVIVPSVVLVLLIGAASVLALATEPRHNNVDSPPPAWHPGRAVRQVLWLPQPGAEREVLVEPRLVLEMRSGSAEAVMVVRRGAEPGTAPGPMAAAAGIGIALRAGPNDPWATHIVMHDDGSPEYRSYLVYTDGTFRENHAEAPRDQVWFIINMKQFRRGTSVDPWGLPVLMMPEAPDHVLQSAVGTWDPALAAELRRRLDAALREAGYDPMEEPSRAR